jgi:hypothetical protein
MVARLQAAKHSRVPPLLRARGNTGRGLGKPTSAWIEELSHSPQHGLVPREVSAMAQKSKTAAPKSKRKTSTRKAVIRKPKGTTPSAKADVRKPKHTPDRIEQHMPTPRREIDSVKPVTIKPRRNVETNDALMFPSGRPIRKR